MLPNLRTPMVGTPLMSMMLMGAGPSGGGGGEVAPEEPQNFAVAVRTDITIGVTWDALPVGQFIRIQSQAAGGDWSAAVENPVYSTGFTVVDCEADTAYDIRIRAENDAGVSDWVTLTDIYTGGMVPPSIVVGPALYGEITVGWDGGAITGVDSVKIYMDGVLAASGINPIGGGYILTGVPTGTNYNIQVSAVGLIGGQEGPLSDAVPCSAGAGTAPYGTGSPSPSISFDLITMTVDVGSWFADPAGISFSYQWILNGTEWYGATSATFNPSPGYYGAYICKVTGTNVVGSNYVFSDPYYLNE